MGKRENISLLWLAVTLASAIVVDPPRLHVATRRDQSQRLQLFSSSTAQIMI